MNKTKNKKHKEKQKQTSHLDKSLKNFQFYY